MFLTGIRQTEMPRPKDQFPWSMRLFHDLSMLEFSARVTFLVGENGCGKSTLLEGLAVGARAIAAGSADIDQDESLWAAHEFARGFRFARKRRASRTLFVRAEDVLGYSLRAARLRQEEKMTLEELDQERIRDQTLPRTGSAEYMKERLTRKYGYDPMARSHGETFLDLLSDRLAPRGLYFLDEPEAPLSPKWILSLLALIAGRARNDCQFVIATHSPILMALPEAQILLLEDDQIRVMPYEELDHVKITKAFLNNPAKFLRHLVGDD